MNEEAASDSAHMKLNPDISYELTNLVESLEWITTHFTSKTPPEELLNGLHQQIVNGDINSFTIEDLTFTTTSTAHQDERKKAATSLAFIYTALAQLNLQANQPMLSWSAAYHAKYNIGLLHGIHSNSTGKIEKGTERARTRAQSGGSQKNENLETIKSLIIEKLCSTSIETKLTSTKIAAAWLTTQLSKTLIKKQLLQDKNENEITAIFKEMLDTDIYIGTVYVSRKSSR
ncbi:hypothetical protein OU997_04170 [Pseudomonas sp. SL4(2022)]|uniref:hypothetical protein n=1 Tax=Pseudomonas sp. SL4(2022) TaxID=2994661 RepID=UPI00226EEBFE|nr:hypothetical protein [Pseudomonas sp. SL4(2022)]WAC45395.1 hypothetical protein OU997_04170 [Pseudomonas sp. SL4(2022)]